MKALKGGWKEIPVFKDGLVIKLNNDSTTDLENFQVVLDITNDASFDKFWNSIADTKLSNCRFIDPVNGVELPYWIEEIDTTNKKARIWIKHPKLVVGNNNFVQILFTNTNTNSPNGDAVFEFFDDFDDGVWNDKWKVIKGSPTITESDSKLRFTSSSTDGYEMVQSIKDFNHIDNFVVEAKFYLSGYLHFDIPDYIENSYRIIIGYRNDDNSLSTYGNNSWISLETPYPKNSTRRIVVKGKNWSSDDRKFSVYVYDENNTLKGYAENLTPYNDDTSTVRKIAFGDGFSYITADFYVDYIHIRKYADKEPTISNVEYTTGTSTSVLVTSPIVKDSEEIAVVDESGNIHKTTANVTSSTKVTEEIDISSLGLTFNPEKAYKKENPSIYISKSFEQEADQNDWYKYQVKITEKPKEITILSDTTNKVLKTSDEILPGEKLLLYNSTDGLKEGIVESVNTVKTSSGIIFQTNISSFNLTSKPEKAFKEPVKVYVSFEKNKDRCLCKDEDISSKIKNATTNSFEFVDDRKNILETGDDLICNGENVKVSKVEIEGGKNVFGLIDSGNNDYLYGIITDLNSNVYVCGCSSNGKNNDHYIAKFDKDLNLIKQITIDTGNDDCLRGITTDLNGNVYVCGYSSNGKNYEHYIAKFDKDLNLIKQITIGYDHLYGITIDLNGNVYVCGHLSYEHYIAKFDKDLNLIKQIIIDSKHYDHLYGITIDLNGNVYVCGYSSNGKNYDYYIAKFDKDLNLIKQITIDSGYYECLYGITTDSNGNVYVCGRSFYEHYIAKFDKDLNLIKQITNGNYHLYGITVDLNGNVYVCGYLNWSYYIAKFDKDLNLIKQITIDIGHDGKLFGITTDSNGNVYVCGYSHNGTNDDHFIAKLNPDLEFNTTTFKLNNITFNIKEVSYPVTERYWTPTEQSWTPQEQSWTPIEHTWTPKTVNYPYYKYVDGYNIKVDIDKTLSSTISSVVIPNRSEEQELEKREYDSANNKIISTYKANIKLDKPGRAIKFRVDGVKDTEVSNVTIDMWTK